MMFSSGSSLVRSDSLLRVVVVEDEEPQRQQLTAWLASMPDVQVVGSAGDGASAVRMIDDGTPDLVFLDVSLPELSGIDVLKRVRHDPEVVFTTAYRDYAIEAFELGAIDYLLKPFGQQRVRAAIDRGRERLHTDPSIPPITERMVSVENDGEPLTRLFVRDRNGIFPVPVSDIVRLEADGDYTAVLTKTRRHLIALPLKTLHDRIRRETFLRVHRQHVVNLDHVTRIEPHDAARLVVRFETGGSIVASRAGSQALRQLAAGRLERPRRA
jgi:two-component system LytT family response regulator